MRPLSRIDLHALVPKLVKESRLDVKKAEPIVI